MPTTPFQMAGLRIDGALAAGVVTGPAQEDDFPQLVPKLSDPAVAAIIREGATLNPGTGAGTWHDGPAGAPFAPKRSRGRRR